MEEVPAGHGLHFPDLSIKGFRGFKEIFIGQLGRVTLITGKNNTGKSSILEALRLHAQNATPSAILSILTNREEYIRAPDEEDRPFDPEIGFHISALFHGFPQLSESFEPIVISTSGRAHRMYLEMGVRWIPEDQDTESVPALIVNTEEGERIRPLETFLRQFSPLGRRGRPGPSEEARMPSVLVSPYGGERTFALGPLWDEIALTDNEEDVVKALQIIDPRISAVSMVGGEVSYGGRRAIVRADNIPRPVPLRSFGDGVNRLFGIVLSLVNAGGGILLIDEFENGLHHSVQSDAWRMIFRLAQRLDVQVFATSHSWDAVEAFQMAASEVPDDGVLLKLTRRDDDIFVTVFAEHELAIATRSRIEVR